MYLNRNEELGRNVFRLFFLLVIGLTCFALLGFLTSIPLKALGYSPLWLNALISALICLYYLEKILSQVIRVVDGNTRLLTHNPWYPRDLAEIAGGDKKVGDKGKQTDPNEYGPGFHFLWPGEEDIEIVSLKTDISKEFTQEISSITDDIPTVEIQFDVEPDPERCAYYILNGEDEKERKSNIQERLQALIRGELEAFFGGLRLEGRKTSGISINVLFKNLTEIREQLTIHFHGENSNLQDECHIMGVRLKRVRVGDINRSSDNSKAIRVSSAARKYKQSAASMVKDLEVSPETAMASALAIGEEIETKGIILGLSGKTTEAIPETIGKVLEALKKNGGNS